jgi:flavin reductase (DIM6/NTAB) family NADH-FMN oxidoreductase RutF
MAASAAIAAAPPAISGCSPGHGIEGMELRRALGRFATGVTVVTTRGPAGRTEGVTVNSFSSVSLDPPLVLWCLRRAAPSAPSFLAAEWFAINVLGADQHHLSRHFATAHPDKFAAVSAASGLGDCPLLPTALARFECRAERSLEAGDHVIFIGRVVRLDHREGEPLVFSGGRFCVPVPLA